MKTQAKQLARALFAEVRSREAEDLDTITEALVKHLADTHQLSSWREIVQAFDSVWKDEFGVANVNVTSATELKNDLQNKLEETFTGASVTMRVDPTLLGGASVRVDDRIIDGTLRGRLQSLKQHLAT
ncbi:MAG: ATP synthase subunit delta [Candidatus Giovannonibacteria bacterium GW2011_GWA2_53_7]|uniref:ATP synthase subunit delta n=1 Tax=Candidatus Giovannonibacteria bacterium GW2011_GWA2_53_7 TaxID=1618650 RepID=A0A0G2AQD2_9BACT|nr:MAG: ATP synthase subunit delta [Candidatus Giovannonibacteria bacterium GW2011_GWA2_53_7]